MIISELNYLESAEAEVFGGRGFTSTTTIDVTADLAKNITETIYKNFVVKASVVGQTAEATAVADVTGYKNALASTYTVTQVEADGLVTGSFAESLSFGH